VTGGGEAAPCAGGTLVALRAGVQLSRFVITYRDVRPSEHVLYDVIGDGYLGVDTEVL
jgi:hypothetical protein